MEELIEKCIEQQFHGIDYIIKITATNEMLQIDVEQRNTGDLWKNQFSASYLEEITSKTGNFKKYPVFLKMLLTSFAKQSESVHIDILTFQDLEQLKSRKNPSNSAMAASKLMPSNKRYLILSYVVEFDKVHYPLPLNYDENPPAEQMKSTIAKLRSDLDALRGNQGNITHNESLKNENEMLKMKLKKMEESVFQLRQNDSGVGIYQRQIEEQNKDIIYMKGLCESKDRELVELRNQLHKFKNESVGQGELMESLRRQQETEKALIDTNKKLFEFEEEIGGLIGDNQHLKVQDKKYKLRIQQLEQELSSTIQRTNVKKPLRSASPANRKSSSLHSRQNPYMVYRKSGDKQTPKRLSRKNSVDSDTESSYQKKIQNKSQVSPSIKASKPRVMQQSPVSSKFSRKATQQKDVKKANPTLRSEVDEEDRLLKKLQELRLKNKENVVLYTPSPSAGGYQDAKQSHTASQFNTHKSSSFVRTKQSDSSCSEDLNSIDERLNKLTSLLKMAKYEKKNDQSNK